MRIIINLSICVLLVALSPFVARAEDWYWGCTVFSGGQYSTDGGFGIDSSSLDGCDPYDALVASGPTSYFGTYHANGDSGWTGSTGFYRSDFRSPLPLAAGSAYTWRFYVWADPTAFGSQITMNIGFLIRAPARVVGSVTLVGKPADIDGGPAVGTVWDVNQPVVQTVLLPMFKSTDGRDGYVFDLTTTVVPEPSSLAALICGLAGVGGAVIRRRS